MNEEISPKSKKLIPSLDLYRLNNANKAAATAGTANLSMKNTDSRLVPGVGLGIEISLLEAAMNRLEELADRIEKQVSGYENKHLEKTEQKEQQKTEAEIVATNATRSYSDYQKLRQPGADSVPSSPREFFNCVFCGVNVSPRGGSKVIKKTDLIREYQRELRSSGETAKLTVETSCADCSSKIKGFCNSPRRLSFNRERSGSPIVSPRDPPSPMLTLVPPGVGSKPIDVRESGISRSPARVNSLESRVSRRNSERGGPYNTLDRSGEIKTSFTPPRLTQSKSFHIGNSSTTNH
jgi:hypothetical protein